MCAILIPALIGVGALAVLGGGGVGDSCGNGYTVTIPQDNGIVTNGTACQMAPQYAYAPQQPQYAGQQVAYAPQQQAYAPQQQAPYLGADVNYNNQSVVGAGGYSNPNGVGIGANVGDVNAGVGLGYPRSY